MLQTASPQWSQTHHANPRLVCQQKNTFFFCFQAIHELAYGLIFFFPISHKNLQA